MSQAPTDRMSARAGLVLGLLCVAIWPARTAAQDRFIVSPWVGRGFYPTTVAVRTLADGTRVTAELGSTTVVGVDGHVRVTGGFLAGVTLVRASPEVTGIVGESGRELSLGSDPAVTVGATLGYRGSVGPGEAWIFAGVGNTSRGDEREDDDLTRLFGTGVRYPLGRSFGLVATARDHISSYDRFTDTPNAAPATTLHEIYLTLGVELRF